MIILTGNRAACALFAIVFGMMSAAQGDENITRIPDTAVRVAESLRDKALQDESAYKFLEGLTTEIGPRLAGGVNDERARLWVIARFKALGFDKVYTEEVTFPRWQRRHESGSITVPFPQKLVLTALGNSGATPAGGLTAEVIQVADLEALKAADPAAIKDKIVYMTTHMQRKRDGGDYGAATAVRHRAPPLAQIKGASAFLMRSVGTDVHQRIAHTGATDFKYPSKPGIPAAALSSPDADQLERELKSGKTVRVRLDIDCGFSGTYTGANVIAEITGSKYPDQVVAIGGHLDSWDLGTGAIDDGAGVAIAFGAAHGILELPKRPDRTIRVIAFANEEAGLFGGKAYAEKHADEVGKHQLGCELDFGAGPTWKMSASVKPSARGAIEQIAAVLKPLGVAYEPSDRASGGSDLSQIHKRGMAAVGLEQDGTDYFDWHHTANDTFDKVNPKELAQNVAVYAVFTYMAAQAEGDFGSQAGAFAAKE
jgi:hypothetical protein